eukprot:snap_masked-scaffold664_size116482-processed-gene-0.7 protein:Tk03083 transcript:snap_masked-scaffold664_size116482-processed-gene-0.7-mRNA-1 annotation:"hypothetical protein CGI_10005286"
MGVSSTLRQKWNNAGKDVPVIHIFPRGFTCPNASPFPLKLETYLRMRDIKYEVDMEHPMGPNSKCPWITLNGTDIGDSQLSVEAILEAHDMKIDPHLTPQEKATARAFMVLNEERFYWVMAMDRFSNENFALVKTFSPAMPGVPGFLQGTLAKFVQRGLRKQTYNHGIGRHCWEDVKEMGLGDLKAFSEQLGNKAFFMGEEPCLLDASMFGMLCQVLYCTREDNFMKKKIQDELSNLEGFVNRIKEKYWEDWEEVLGKLEKPKETKTASKEAPEDTKASNEALKGEAEATPAA